MAVRTVEFKGAEAREETGIGTVIKVEHEEGKRNAKVSVKNDDLQHPLHGWVGTDEEAWPHALWAYENRQTRKIWYRFVVHRKRGFDPAMPIADVPKESKIKALVEIRLEPPGPEEVAAQTAVAPAAPLPTATPAPSSEGPKAATAPPAPAGLPPVDAFETAAPPAAPPQPVAAPFTPTVRMREVMGFLRNALRAHAVDDIAAYEDELLRLGVPIDAIAQGTGRKIEQVMVGAGRATRERGAPDLPPPGVHPAATAALAAAKDPDRVREQARPAPDLSHVDGSGPTVSQTSGLSRRQGAQPVASDSRPWEVTNSDGRPNLSSYAAGATMEFVNLAGRLIVGHLRQRASEDSAYELKAPGRDTVLGLAQLLLGAADQAQVSLLEGARVDRMAASHKLARQAIRESIDLFPVPWGSGPDEVEAWRQQLVAHASTLLDVGWTLLTP
jgi:hypothetical protein